MRQIRITTETFRLPGDDPTIPDAYVDPDELARMKKLAGIDSLGITEKPGDSPISGDIGSDNAEYQRKHNIQPGTDEWFKLWFARTPLTGEKPKPKD